MASTPFWFTAAGNGDGGTNSSVPSPVPEDNTNNTPGNNTNAQSVDLSSYFNMFGMNPGNTPSTVPNSNAPGGPMGFFPAIQQWVNQNPGTAMLMGLLLMVLVGDAVTKTGRR